MKKKKWYRGNAVKAAWIVLVHAAAVVLGVSLLIFVGLYSSGITLGDAGRYEQSASFASELYSYAQDAYSVVTRSEIFAEEPGTGSAEAAAGESGAGTQGDTGEEPGTESLGAMEETGADAQGETGQEPGTGSAGDGAEEPGTGAREDTREDTRVVDLDEIEKNVGSDQIGYTLSGDGLSYENTSGLAYSLEDLMAWAMDSWDRDVYSSGKNILVCVQPDGTQSYCYYSDFQQQVADGELQLCWDTQLQEQSSVFVDDENVLEQLRDGVLPEGTACRGVEAVADADGTIKYTDVSTYPGDAIAEKYAPQGAESLLEVINTQPQWQGRLEEAYSALETALNLAASYASAEERMEAIREEASNATFLYVDETRQRVVSNREEYEGFSDAEKALEQLISSGAYVVLRPGGRSETNIGALDGDADTLGWDILDLQSWQYMAQYLEGDSFFAVQVDTDFPATDSMSKSRNYYEKYSGWPLRAAWAAVIAGILLLTGLIWLTTAAGRRPDDEELYLAAPDRWFTEISAGATAGVWLLGVAFTIEALGGIVDSGIRGGCIVAGILSVFTAAMFLIGYLSLVRRIKAKILWKNSLLRWLLGVCGRILKKLRRLVGIYARNTRSKIKMTIFVIAFLGVQFIICAEIFGGFFPELLLLLLVVDAAALAWALVRADGTDRILDGLKRISGGELQYKIPLEHMRGEQKTMAEYINNIGSGLDAAVENSLKNERMKTELITNVSHDLKTPLTSIINYVELLKRENFTDPKVCGYLKVLEEKAYRLKTLTEDVVEASKASTGNLSLEMTELDFVEMLRQVIGEFEEKFGEKNLTMMVHFTDEPSVIYADGQRMWRVLENIFNNVVKYAMEGTRVYAELKNADKKVTFSLKNISAQPLNISADELTERFIRGDVSRNTEGSGLGLSIAKSLTELQGGEFQLYLDGDLFKVTITFAGKS